jgi:plastocyanin
MPQVAQLTVAEEAAAAQDEPAADLNVNMADFVFGLPVTVAAGEAVWRITNTGEQWHELAIAPVEPGTTVEDVQAWLGEGGDFAQQQLPVLMPMDAGQTVWVDVNLAPGTYAIICNLPDVMAQDGMHIHYDLGMIQIVTVTETATYEDANGQFTVEYPAAFTAVRPDLAREFGMPFPSVGFADSEETLTKSSAAEVVPGGGWGIGVILVPAAFFAGMGMPADAPLSDLAIALFTPEPGNAEGAEIVGIEEITLSNGKPAIRGEAKGATEDNLSLFFELEEGLYALVALVAAVDGVTEAMAVDMLAVANSLTFTGSLEDVLAGMGGE